MRVGKPDAKDIDSYEMKMLEGAVIYIARVYTRLRGMNARICLKDTVNGKLLYTKLDKVN